VVLRNKLRRELVEDMSGIPGSAQKYEWPPRTAPIEHFQLDIAIHGNKLDAVRRGIAPRDGLLRGQTTDQRNQR
jgi:hypothetical protein